MLARGRDPEYNTRTMSHVLLSPSASGAPRPRIVALPDPSPAAVLAEGRAAALIDWIALHQERVNRSDHTALRFDWSQEESFSYQWIETGRVPGGAPGAPGAVNLLDR